MTGSSFLHVTMGVITLLLLALGCTEEEAPANPCPAHQGLGIEKVLILGNSITHHHPDPERGWLGDWGMAASAATRDYLHILMDSIQRYSPTTLVEKINAVPFERGYEQFDPEVYYEGAHRDADLIIFRFGENVESSALSPAFADRLEELAAYFQDGRPAYVVCVSSFWYKPGVIWAMRNASSSNKWFFVTLHDLSDDPGNTAKGLFEDRGIAGHPGDQGMALIAQRIWGEISCFFQ